MIIFNPTENDLAGFLDQVIATLSQTHQDFLTYQRQHENRRCVITRTQLEAKYNLRRKDANQFDAYMGDALRVLQSALAERGVFGWGDISD